MQYIRTFALITVVLFVGSIAAADIYAQSRTNSTGTGGIHQIRGRIYLPNGRSPDNPIRVELQSTSSGSLTVETDHSGSYAFRNLAPGSYTVIVDSGDVFEVSREYVVIDPDIQMEMPGQYRPPASPKTVTLPINLRLSKTARNETLKNEVINAKWVNVPNSAIDKYNRSLELLRKKKKAQAIEELRSSIKEYAAFAPAHVQLGKLYLADGKVDEALAELESAVQYDPDSFEARVTYGICLLNKKSFAEASQELTKAAQMDQTAVTPRYYLGLVFLQERQLDKALKEMEAASALNGETKFPLLHRYLGGIYLAVKEEDKAVKELELYVAQEPNGKDTDRIRQTISDLKKGQD